jgi:XTP/dITP diphosphohydrolase
LPALARAQKTLERAERAGLTPEAEPARPLVELVESCDSEDQLGELLLAVVGSARNRGFDAERALRGAVRRYQNTESPGS